MALEETIEYDKIEVVGQYKACTGQKLSVVKKDGTELARSFTRYVLDPGTLDDDDNLVDNPLQKNLMVQQIYQMRSKQYARLWTPTVKVAWKTKLISDKSINNP